MKQVRTILLAEFWAPIAICLALIVIYENEWLLPGDFAGDKTLEYHVAIAMELITICLIPLALRLFKFKKVKADISVDPVAGMRKWGSWRTDMLTIPMMLNCWCYYLFMSTTFGYMGIIGLLCLAFVYPSKARMEQESEIGSAEEGNENNRGDNKQE